MSEEQRFRYERKLVAPESALAEIEEIVKRHPAAFREAFPQRTVVSIYFDSLAFDRYRDHVTGCGDRSKIRIRWYGEPRGDVESPVMEWKVKHGLLGEKLRYRLPPFRFEHDVPVDSPTRWLDRSLLPPAREEELRETWPVLLVWYRRRYFISAGERYRLTLDWEMHYRGGSPLRGTLDGPVWRPASTILEVKYGREDDGDAPSVMNHFPFRIARYSKYVAGMSGLRKVEAPCYHPAV